MRDYGARSPAAQSNASTDAAAAALQTNSLKTLPKELHVVTSPVLPHRNSLPLLDVIPEFGTNQRDEEGELLPSATANDVPANRMLTGLLSELSPVVSSPIPFVRRRAELQAQRRRSSMQVVATEVQNQILSDYVMEKTIGEGCFSKVKLGTHIPTGSKVAIKCMEKSAIRKNVGTAERVLREILVLSHLYHPNITRLLEVIDAETHIYLVLEYEAGGELFDYILSVPVIPESTSRRFLRQMVSAVSYCHANGICHRDLKPENILLDAKGNLKIIDFGFANVMRDDKPLDTFCGSAAYASPEMISRKKYNGNESDVWSIGVILFVLVCGRLPFDDRNLPKMFTAIMLGKYTFPDGISEGAKSLLASMLKTKPSERATLEDVRVHPWTNDHGNLPMLEFYRVPSDGPGSESSRGDPDHLRDESIIEEIIRMGFSAEEVDDAMKSRDPGPVMSCYHLLRAERERDLNACPKLTAPMPPRISTAMKETPLNSISERDVDEDPQDFTPRSVVFNRDAFDASSPLKSPMATSANYVTFSIPSAPTSAPDLDGGEASSGCTSASSERRPSSQDKGNTLFSRIRSTLPSPTSPVGPIESSLQSQPTSTRSSGAPLRSAHFATNLSLKELAVKLSANFSRFQVQTHMFSVSPAEPVPVTFARAEEMSSSGPQTSSSAAANSTATGPWHCRWTNVPNVSSRDVIQSATVNPDEAMSFILEDLLMSEKVVTFIVRIDVASLRVSVSGRGGCHNSSNDEDGHGHVVRFFEEAPAVLGIEFRSLMAMLVDGI